MDNQPWSLRETVAKLCEAAEILLHEHDYDGHGHEGITYALQAAKRWLDTPPPAVVPDDKFLPDLIERVKKDFVPLEEVEDTLVRALSNISGYPKLYGHLTAHEAVMKWRAAHPKPTDAL